MYYAWWKFKQEPVFYIVSGVTITGVLAIILPMAILGAYWGWSLVWETL